MRGRSPAHTLTTEEQSRGGQTTARRYLCAGRWHPNWLDRCDNKVRNDEGDYDDGPEEDDGSGPGERGPE